MIKTQDPSSYNKILHLTTASILIEKYKVKVIYHKEGINLNLQIK